MITFTSNKNDPERGDWDALKFENTNKENMIEYCNIWYSGVIASNSASLTLINNSICYGGGIDLHCCSAQIINNAIDRGGISLSDCDSQVINNTITNNSWGIYLVGGNLIVSGNIISNCDVGIVVSGGKTQIVKYNYITHNKVGIQLGGNAQIQGNIIINNQYGINWICGSANISQNVIIFNERDGITIDLQMWRQSQTSYVNENNITNNENGINIISITHSGVTESPYIITNNNIYENMNYDMLNNVKFQINATNNWWGTTDTLKIDEKIYDYYDDFEFGKVLYLPILIAPNPNAPDASPYSKDTSGESDLFNNDNGKNNLDLFNPTIIPGVLVGGTITSLGAAAIIAKINENWKFLLLSLFGVPLYSRIHGKKTLDNFVRGQVYGHIQSKPGTHFNEIRKTLKLGNGNLAYHLRKLEKEGFITSKRDKRNRRFYPVGVEVPEEDGIKLSKTQENILDYIERHPKSSQKDIARKIKESQQTISYNINVLVREGFLKEEKINGTKRYEIFDENT
jgi:parallel beta-helix repeat protein